MAAHAQAPSKPKDDLVIGVAQFPSSLHPDVDAEVVKSYVNEFVIRPITAFDASWKNTCLLCTELPTLENGLAKVEDLPDGSKGMAVTLKLKPDLKWGDGQPVTAKDVAFTWKVGNDPNSGFSNPHPWSRASKVDIVDDHTVVLHLKRRGRLLQPVGPDPARAYRGPDLRRGEAAGRLHQADRLSTARRPRPGFMTARS